jgi:hypothetical protein
MFQQPVVFPKGVYQPMFQTEDGVFYEAPTFVSISWAGKTFHRGGLFIPNNPSAKQGFWTEEDFRDLAFRGRRFTFREPVPYH